MQKFSGLYEFTDQGMELFERAMRGEIDEKMIDPLHEDFALAIEGSSCFEVSTFATSKQMAETILSAMGSRAVPDLLIRNKLWAWLTFVLRDQVCPIDKEGRRKLGEIHRWYPSDVNDFQKSQRHLVRMPVSLLHSLSENADHLLAGKPDVPGEIREQLTSQQGMFHSTFQSVARKLYFDEATGKFRRGAAGKGGGSATRLRQIRKQLDVTWDLFVTTPDQLFELLPAEFNKFKQV